MKTELFFQDRDGQRHREGPHRSRIRVAASLESQDRIRSLGTDDHQVATRPVPQNRSPTEVQLA